MFCYVWEYRVKSACIDAFESAYRPDGRWARLFRNASGYMKTELLRDLLDANHYVTVDYWEDQEDYVRFAAEFESEYRLLDRVCQRPTLNLKDMSATSTPGRKGSAQSL